MFEVWETRSGNLAGAYETREEALTVVRAAAERHGKAYLDGFSLLTFVGGQHHTIAEGRELASLALASSANFSAPGQNSAAATGRSRSASLLPPKGKRGK